MAYPSFPGNEFLTHGVDVNHNFFKFAIGAAGAVGTLSQGSGGFVTSVTRTAEGIYTVQLAKPYPASLLFINPSLSLASADSASLRVSYDSGTYSATAGTFVINTADIDDLSGNAEAVAFSAADPENGAEVMVHYAFLNV